MRLDPNVDAEYAVVGAVLINPATLDSSRAKLNSNAFTYEPCRLTFAAMESLRDQGKPIDALSIKTELESRGTLERVGGVSFLAELSSKVPVSENVGYYAKLVAEQAGKSDLMTLLRSRTDDAARNSKSMAAIISDLLSDLDELGVHANDTPQRTDVADLLRNPPPDVQYLFEGVLPRGVLAGCDAQGGAGKSMLAQILVTSACTGRVLLESFRPSGAMKVLWIESEDPPDEIARRFDRIFRAYDLGENPRTRLAENLTFYAGQSFALNQVLNKVVTPTELYRWLQREVKRVQPDLIILDPRSHYFAGDENSNTDVAAYMNLLKALTSIPERACSVWISHHVSKAHEADASSASGRGASAARDAIRALWSLTPLLKSECEAAGIELTSGFVKLECTKANWTPLGNGPIYLKRLQAEFGGVLVETDMGNMRAEAGNARLDALAREFARMLGDNPEDLTVRDIARKPGTDLRHDLKMKLGNHVTIPAVEKAIEHGVKASYLAIDSNPTKPFGAKIPRQKRMGDHQG